MTITPDSLTELDFPTEAEVLAGLQQELAATYFDAKGNAARKAYEEGVAHAVAMSTRMLPAPVPEVEPMPVWHREAQATLERLKMEQRLMMQMRSVSETRYAPWMDCCTPSRSSRLQQYGYGTPRRAPQPASRRVTPPRPALVVDEGGNAGVLVAVIVTAVMVTLILCGAIGGAIISSVHGEAGTAHYIGDN